MRSPARACSQVGAPSLPDGPPLLVVVIGDPCGRWSLAECKAGAAMEAAWAAAAMGVLAPPVESPMILGFAVLRAWHFIMELDGPTTKAMSEACQRTRGSRRPVVGALRHQFLAACALSDPIPVPLPEGVPAATVDSETTALG